MSVKSSIDFGHAHLQEICLYEEAFLETLRRKTFTLISPAIFTQEGTGQVDDTLGDKTESGSRGISSE